MKKRNITKKLLAATLLSALFLTGCAGKSASSTPVSENNAVSDTAIEEEATPAVAEDKAKDSEPIVVTFATTSDENRIWDALNEELAARGENIRVEYINVELAVANRAVADGEVDLNSFQHYAYFEQNTADLGLDLTPIGETLIVPLSLFSDKYESVDEIPDGGTIAFPEDATNEGRSLHVLEKAGLIKLKDGVGVNGTKADIVENPKNLEFVQVGGAEVPSLLPDVDAAIINCGFSVDYGLDPIEDPIFKDDIDLNDPAQHPFVNIIAARTADKDNEIYLKVVDAYHSERVANAILEVYKKAAIPAFDY